MKFAYGKRLVDAEQTGDGVLARSRTAATADRRRPRRRRRHPLHGPRAHRPGRARPPVHRMLGFEAVARHEVDAEAGHDDVRVRQARLLPVLAGARRRHPWGANLPLAAAAEPRRSSGGAARASGCDMLRATYGDDDPGRELIATSNADEPAGGRVAAHHAARAALAPGPDGAGRRRGARAVEQFGAGRVAGHRERGPARPLPARPPDVQRRSPRTSGCAVPAWRRSPPARPGSTMRRLPVRSRGR